MRVLAGASNSAQVQLVSTGTQPFSGLVALTSQGLPAGASARFEPAPAASQPIRSSFQSSRPRAPQPLGTYPILLRGEFVEAGQPLVRTATLDLILQSDGRHRRQGTLRHARGHRHRRRDRARRYRPRAAAADDDRRGGQLPARRAAGGSDHLPLRRHAGESAVPDLALHHDARAEPDHGDPRLDDQSAAQRRQVRADRATAPQDQVITDPRFPGLEIRIPAGTHHRLGRRAEDAHRDREDRPQQAAGDRAADPDRRGVPALLRHADGRHSLELRFR